MEKKVGFIGLGMMGKPMAANLLSQGFSLTVWNRTLEKAKELVDQGARVASSPEEAARDCEFVITMVADDDALSEVTLSENGLLAGLRAGGIHVSMSTISPRLAGKLRDKHSASGSFYLGCPVFGRPDAAASAELLICVSGDPAARQRVKQMLSVLGRAVYDFGDDAVTAPVVKLAGNFLIASAVEALGEAIVFARKNGVEPDRLVEMMSSTLFCCPIYQTYGKIVAEKRFKPPGFRLRLGLKDVNLVCRTAQDSLVPMPLANILHDHLLAALARGREDFDWTALTLALDEQAGLGN